MALLVDLAIWLPPVVVAGVLTNFLANMEFAATTAALAEALRLSLLALATQAEQELFLWVMLAGRALDQTTTALAVVVGPVQSAELEVSTTAATAAQGSPTR